MSSQFFAVLLVIEPSKQFLQILDKAVKLHKPKLLIERGYSEEKQSEVAELSTRGFCQSLILHDHTESLRQFFQLLKDAPDYSSSTFQQIELLAYGEYLSHDFSAAYALTVDEARFWSGEDCLIRARLSRCYVEPD